MKNVVLAIATGIALVSIIFILPESHSSASEENPEEITVEEDIEINSLIQALEQVKDGIEDEDLKDYYSRLIDEYKLDEIMLTDSTELISTDILPDIDHIARTSMTMPLKEAGKNIQDEEIRDFYYSFLKDVGWDFAQ